MAILGYRYQQVDGFAYRNITNRKSNNPILSILNKIENFSSIDEASEES